MCLKRKKMYEAQVTRLLQTRMNMESQIFALEGAQSNIEVFGAMKEGTGQMQKMQQQVNIDAVDNVKEDLEEQMDLANEVNEVMGEAIGGGAMEDEDDLLAELDELGEEEGLGELDGLEEPAGQVEAPAVPGMSMPSAPDAAIMPSAPEGKVELTADEAAMKALEAEMGM